MLSERKQAESIISPVSAAKKNPILGGKQPVEVALFWLQNCPTPPFSAESSICGEPLFTPVTCRRESVTSWLFPSSEGGFSPQPGKERFGLHLVFSLAVQLLALLNAFITYLTNSPLPSGLRHIKPQSGNPPSGFWNSNPPFLCILPQQDPFLLLFGSARLLPFGFQPGMLSFLLSFSTLCFIPSVFFLTQECPSLLLYFGGKTGISGRKCDIFGRELIFLGESIIFMWKELIFLEENDISFRK